MKKKFLKSLCLVGLLLFMMPAIKVNAIETNITEINALENEMKAKNYGYDFKFADKENLKENAKKLPKLKTSQIANGCSCNPYNKEVEDWISEFYNFKLQDYNYLKNYKIYKDKKIEELSVEETLSYMTYIIRGERFCDGHIGCYLENGLIEKLCNNLSRSGNNSPTSISGEINCKKSH